MSGLVLTWGTLLCPIVCMCVCVCVGGGGEGGWRWGVKLQILGPKAKQQQKKKQAYQITKNYVPVIISKI